LAQVPTGGDSKEMSQSLGEKLRQAREARGISISEVAEQTRISTLYLKSIEADDYKPLPGGIFNKGFVRSYARYVGFDENEALQDYNELMAENELPSEADQRIHHSEVWTDDSNSSMAPTIIFAVVILVLLGGGIVLLVRYLSGPSSPNLAVGNTTKANSNINSNSENPISVPLGNAPTAAAFSVELKADGEPVWVGYTIDGNKTEKTLNPGESLKLDVQDSLRLSYAKVKAQSLELSIDGKHINVLSGGPKGNFDLDINKSNFGQIMQTGELGTPPPTPRPTQAATPRPTPKPTISPAATPRPPTTLPNANVVKRPPQ
jgi:transcriptional regulator with XRE-family HTH domain